MNEELLVPVPDNHMVYTILIVNEKLDVYRVPLEFIVLADNIIENLPKGKAYRADQLKRAGFSIPLNIAEGAAIPAGDLVERESVARSPGPNPSGKRAAVVLDSSRTNKVGSGEKPMKEPVTTHYGSNISAPSGITELEFNFVRN